MNPGPKKVHLFIGILAFLNYLMIFPLQKDLSPFGRCSFLASAELEDEEDDGGEACGAGDDITDVTYVAVRRVVGRKR